MKRLLFCLALLLVSGCAEERAAQAERCNERGGILAEPSYWNRDRAPAHTPYCFRPDTISLAVPRIATPEAPAR